MFDFDSYARKRLERALNRFTTAAIRVGLTYLEEDRVTQAFSSLNGFRGGVFGETLYSVTWSLIGASWRSKCTCPFKTNCKHAYALAKRALTQGLLSGDEVRSEFSDKAPTHHSAAGKIFAQKLGRALSENEAHFVDRLEELHRRVARSFSPEVVGPSDFMTLDLPQTLVDGDRGVPMKGWWRQPPKTPLDLLNYLALAVEKSNAKLPPWLEPLVSLDQVREEVKSELLPQEVAAWKQHLQHRPSLAKVLDQPALRLRWDKDRFLWETASTPNGVYQKIHPRELCRLCHLTVEEMASLDPKTRSLLGVRRMFYLSERKNTLSLQVTHEAVVLHYLFFLPELRDRLVTDLGTPIEDCTEELVWGFSAAPESSADYLKASLVLPSQGTPMQGLEYLSGPPPLYFDGKKVYRGPYPLTLSGEFASTVSVPTQVLKLNPELVLQLKNEKCQIPQDLVPVVRTVEIRPQALFKLDPLTDQQSHLVVQLTGVPVDEEQTLWTYTQEGWQGGQGSVPHQRDAQGNLIVINRERADEVAKELKQAGFIWFLTKQAWCLRFDESTIPHFLKLVEKMQYLDVSVSYGNELAAFFNAAQEVIPQMRVREVEGQIDWFDVSVDWGLGELELTPEELSTLLLADGAFVELKGKGWKRIHFHLDQKFDSALKELGLDPEDRSSVETQRYHALQLASPTMEGVLEEQQLGKLRQLAARLVHKPIKTPAKAFKGTLRPYQLDGLNFLSYLSQNQFGGVLADDMGLGKTVQTISWLVELAATHRKELRVLIVCPKSVFRNWESEIARFAPKLGLTLLRPQQELNQQPLGVLLTNYAQLRQREEFFLDHPWTAVVLDEAQYIKNPQSAVSQLVRKLKAGHRLALTGTPIENRPLDLWSIFSFAQPGLLGSMAQFKRLYDQKNLDNPTASLARLQKRVRHFMLRRTKVQVTPDLPERIEEDLWVDLEGEQEVMYQAELKKARSLLTGIGNKKQLDKARFNILQSLLRLRQICCDPRLRTKDNNGPVCSAKLEAMLERVEPLLAEGHKVIIFSQFVEMLGLIEQEIVKRGVRYALLTGQTENRAEIVETFQNDPACQIFLLSLKAGGVGLNLTAASYVILYDPWWNPAVEAQAIDRAHRIGQKNTVIAYRLVAKGTIEEKIRLLQKKKSEVAKAVVQEESLATVLDLEALSFLLSEEKE